MTAAQPPYLVTALIGRRGAGVAVTGDAGLAMIEVAAYGRWSPDLGNQVSATLRMCLAGPIGSIIVDLGELIDPLGTSLSFWLAMWRAARLRSRPVQLVFCLPATTALSSRLRHLPGPQPRVFAGVPEARAAIADRMSRADRLQIRLAPRPASIRAARALVTEACQAWRRPEPLEDLWLIVSELATNAVEHARTDFVVTLSRAGDRLNVAVHDCADSFPDPAEREVADPRAPLGERGRGLRLVHSIAAAWGVMPARDGKVVWASLAGEA